MLENIKINKIKQTSNKSFGLVFSLFFLIIGLIPIFLDRNVNFYLIIISLLLLILSLYFSKILTVPNYLWFKLGMYLNFIVSPLIMFIIFYLVVTPTGLIFKIINFKLLKIKWNDKNNSSWVKKNIVKSSFKDQF